MILADTSIWVEFLRSGHDQLAAALAAADVAGHPWVVGELALGGATREVLDLLERLPRATLADDAEVMRLIADETLAQTGIGWVDAHLLASARLTPGARLLTADRKLATQAQRLGIAASVR